MSFDFLWKWKKNCTLWKTWTILFGVNPVWKWKCARVRELLQKRIWIHKRRKLSLPKCKLALTAKRMGQKQRSAMSKRIQKNSFNIYTYDLLTLITDGICALSHTVLCKSGMWKESNINAHSKSHRITERDFLSVSLTHIFTYCRSADADAAAAGASLCFISSMSEEYEMKKAKRRKRKICKAAVVEFSNGSLFTPRWKLWDEHTVTSAAASVKICTQMDGSRYSRVGLSELQSSSKLSSLAHQTLHKMPGRPSDLSNMYITRILHSLPFNFMQSTIIFFSISFLVQIYKLIPNGCNYFCHFDLNSSSIFDNAIIFDGLIKWMETPHKRSWKMKLVPTSSSQMMRWHG